MLGSILGGVLGGSVFGDLISQGAQQAAAMRTLGYRTQNDLARAIGVSRSAVSLWLEGKVGVPRPVAMLLRMLIAAQRRSY